MNTVTGLTMDDCPLTLTSLIDRAARPPRLTATLPYFPLPPEPGVLGSLLSVFGRLGP